MVGLVKVLDIFGYYNTIVVDGVWAVVWVIFVATDQIESLYNVRGSRNSKLRDLRMPRKDTGRDSDADPADCCKLARSSMNFLCGSSSRVTLYILTTTPLKSGDPLICNSRAFSRLPNDPHVTGLRVACSVLYVRERGGGWW